MPDSHPILQHFQTSQHVRIVDFGCRLAQHSISLLEQLSQRGVNGELVLCDMPTIRFNLLTHIVKGFGLKATLLECTKSLPIPDFPPSDIIIATEVFEHLHSVTRRINARTPNRSALHEKLMHWGWDEINSRTLYQKD